MVKKLVGTKLGMTRTFLDDGSSIAVTALEIGPCFVTQRKTLEKDGYNSIQVGYGPIKEKRLNKPLKGHFKASGTDGFANLVEIKVDEPENYELGQELTLDIFDVGELVKIVGTSKGRGFSGVIKRWGFGGGRKTHGSHSHRIPGSIGCSAKPGKVSKGKKMPGHMGNQRTTVKNLKIIEIRPEINLILVKGAVPGSCSGLIEISKII